jgi:hypothetical protein
MATKVYETDNVTLFSGKKVSLRPLKISILRDFMAEFEKIGVAATDNAASMDVIVDCVAIAMRQYDPALAEDKTALEDEIDLPTAYKIIEVAAGIKLGDDADPNPKAAGLSGAN